MPLKRAARHRMRALLLLAVFLMPACAGVQKVHMSLPLRPRLPLKGNERIAIAPFVVVTHADKPKDKADLAKIDLQAEFHRYLIHELERQTHLQVVDLGDSVTLPSRDIVELSRDTQFWRDLGEKNSANIVVSGTLDFRVQDNTGYRTEEYVSPINGRTYYRQIYVEQTGFLFDIVFLCFDGKTGDKLLQDEFKDFKQRNERRADELLGLFQNLFSLEEQILNIFVPRQRPVERYLFTR